MALTIKNLVLANSVRSGYESQTKLAAACGYNDATLSYKLRNADRMTLQDLAVIARKTQMPDADIVAIIRMAGGKR